MKTDAERILSDTSRKDALNRLSLMLSEMLFEKGFFTTCCNCEHWIEGPPDNKQQICGLYKIRPPTKIIVAGCESHSDNIPF